MAWQKALEMDSHDGCITMWIYVIPLNSTLVNEQNGKVYDMYTLLNKNSKIKKHSEIPLCVH